MKQFTYEQVKNIFIQKDCTLLSTEYTGSKQQLQYICKCGNNSETTVTGITRINGCMNCNGTPKYSIQDAKTIFLKYNCTLLDEIYIDNGTKMKYKCNVCEFNYDVTLGSFIKRVDKCKNCRFIKDRKEMFNRIKREFEKQECELLETEYINNRTKISYKCKCGNVSDTTYNAFQKGRRCMKCYGTPKHTYKYVEDYFEKNNCILISDEYQGNLENLEYICECGNYSEITFGNFQNGHRCMKCSGKEKYTYEYVKKCFEDISYTLINIEYIGCNDKLSYICNKNHNNVTNFTKFITGYRCPKCLYKTEQIVNKFLEENYKNVIHQAKFNWCKNKTYLPFDFLLDDQKLLIEVDGKQHFIQVSNWISPEKTQERDIFKMKLAIDHDYSIIRISQEDIYNNTIDWKEMLKKNIKKYKKPKIIYIGENPELYINHKF